MRTAGSVAGTEEIEDKETEPEQEQTVIRGRGGTAFGSALHAAPQDFVELLSECLPLDQGATVDDVLPGVGDVIEKLVIVDHKSDIVADSAELSAKMNLYRWQGAALREMRPVERRQSS